MTTPYIYISASEVSKLHNIQRQTPNEVGGIIDFDENNRVANMSVVNGTENNFNIDVETYNGRVVWHAHTVRKGYPTPPSPRDMKTSLSLHLLGHTRADLLLSNEGIYMFWPTKRLMRHPQFRSYYDIMKLYRAMESVYTEIAHTQNVTPEQKRGAIISYYIQLGFYVDFVPWEIGEQYGIQL